MLEILLELYNSDLECIACRDDPECERLYQREEARRLELEAMLSGEPEGLFDQYVSLRCELESRVCREVWLAGCRFGAHLLRELCG